LRLNCLQQNAVGRAKGLTRTCRHAKQTLWLATYIGRAWDIK